MHCIHTISLGCKNCQQARAPGAQRPPVQDQIAEPVPLLQPSLLPDVEPYRRGVREVEKELVPTGRRRSHATAPGQITLDL